MKQESLFCVTVSKHDLIDFLFHCQSLITGGKGTAKAKIKAMKQAGIHVTDSPALMGQTILRAILQQD